MYHEAVVYSLKQRATGIDANATDLVRLRTVKQTTVATVMTRTTIRPDTRPTITANVLLSPEQHYTVKVRHFGINAIQLPEGQIIFPKV